MQNVGQTWRLLGFREIFVPNGVEVRQESVARSEEDTWRRRDPTECHIRLSWCTVALTGVANSATCNYICPGGSTSSAPWENMVEG
jgi:hypothetical protein